MTVDLLQLILLGVIGILGGILSGLVGVGGGIVFVPGLIYVGGWTIKEAVAASLVIIAFSSLSGTVRSARNTDSIDWRVAGILSLAVAPASLIGVAISRVSPEAFVEIAFAAILLALAYPTARGRQEFDESKKIPIPLVFVAGIFIGTLAGLVGVGGGVVMVPLMVFGMGIGAKRAISTSLAVILFTGIVGAAGYIATGFLGAEELLSLPPLIVGSMIGAPLGVRIRDRLPTGVVRGVFASIMVVVALRLLSEALGLF
jgi:uncharacterized protein